MRLYLFDDRAADSWWPYALSRPCSELLYGTLLLRERLERFAGTAADGLLSRPWLASFSEEGAPPCVRVEEVDAGADRLFLSSRAVPEPAAAFEPPQTPSTLEIDGVVVGAFLPSGAETPDASWFADPTPLGTTLGVDGEVPRHVWELVNGSAARTAADLLGSLPDVPPASGTGPGERIGDAPLQIAPDVRVEPGVLFDLRDGPVCLDREVEVRAGSRLSGPLYVGPAGRLLGGSISGLSAGPVSYLRGEIEESVVLGYTNKAHDGFLGHAYLGRWANLGALTTNSDLKNTYGSVRLAGPEGEVDTGLMKLGCLIGDHVKTAIGTLITTGAVLGCGANVFGPQPPKWLPPFSWGNSDGLYRLDGFLSTAETAMRRRGVRFGDAERTWLTDVWEAARAGRT